MTPAGWKLLKGAAVSAPGYDGRSPQPETEIANDAAAEPLLQFS